MVSRRVRGEAEEAMMRLKGRGPVDVLKLIDTRRERSKWREEVAELQEIRPWFRRIARLYGRPKVMKLTAAVATSFCLRPREAAAWIDYYERILDRREPHLVPTGLLLGGPGVVPFNIAGPLAVAPRVA